MLGYYWPLFISRTQQYTKCVMLHNVRAGEPKIPPFRITFQQVCKFIVIRAAGKHMGKAVPSRLVATIFGNRFLHFVCMRECKGQLCLLVPARQV